MLPVLANHSGLFHPWHPDVAPEPATRQRPVYLELPPVRNFQELLFSNAFAQIRAQFLEDIRKLQKLAFHFVGDQYNHPMNVFYHKMEQPPDDLVEHILPLYRETRFQIHQLVYQLSIYQNGRAEQKEYIASLLHDCLNGIDHCPAGVHSRFANSFLDLKATQAGLDGKLYKIRNDLLHEFITSFLFQTQREGILHIPEGMEIHWFNGLHNLYCDCVALQPIVDPRAPTGLAAKFVTQFLSSAELSVTACTILRKMSAQWSDQLSMILYQQGVRAWETEDIDPARITTDITQALENELFRPVNHLLKTSTCQALDLHTIAEENDDGYYRLNRHREKLLGWVTNYFYGPATSVFAVIYSDPQSCTCIGSINQLFFWVFDHNPRLSAKQPCTFPTDNHTTLTLAHLTNVDFSTWPIKTSHALLTQAMGQTDSPKEIADFFLGRATTVQLEKMPRPVIEVLAHQMSEKLARNPATFQKRLSRRIGQALVRQSPKPPLKTLLWLLDTPLLEPVLFDLYRAQQDITPLTGLLSSWQISSFCRQSLATLLTQQDCHRLFQQAFALKQGQTVCQLMLTGRCNSLVWHPRYGRADYLCLFARHGILPGLQYLLELPGTDVNGRDCRGWSPLATAARFGNTQCLEALLAVAGIDVNARTNSGNTALVKAVVRGHLACVRALLGADGIKPDLADHNNWTPLQIASKQGHCQCLAALLPLCTGQINDKNPLGHPPLASAAFEGHTECVRLLVQTAGVQLNLTTDDGRTPLLCAACNGHTDCVKTLLALRSTWVNEPNHQGCTPLHAAAEHGHDECIMALLCRNDLRVNAITLEGFTALDCAAIFGHSRCLEILLSAKRIRINMNMGRQNQTPLFSAARGGHVDCVRLLLNADGIKVNRRNVHNCTPLHVAALYGHNNCLEALLGAANINVNAQELDGHTPLHFAALQDRTECIRTLLQVKHLNVNQKNNRRCTAVHLAARKPYADSLSALLEAKSININERNDDGWTPLHCAISRGNTDCVRALLGQSSIKVNKRTCFRLRTPLIVGIDFDRTECVKLLLEHERTSLNRLDITLNTALSLARKYNMSEIITVLEEDDRLCRPIDRVLKMIGR